MIIKRKVMNFRENKHGMRFSLIYHLLQDGGGTGTVTSVDTIGWATVKWDNNFTNSYRYGVQNKYDIQKVGSHAATTPPRTSTISDRPLTTAPPTAGAGLANALYVGGRVQRGVDWRYGDQVIICVDMIDILKTVFKNDDLFE
jgi:hypothetical protein